MYAFMRKTLYYLSVLSTYTYIKKLFKSLKIVLSTISKSVLPTSVPIVTKTNTILTNNRLNFYITYKLNIEDLSVVASKNTMLYVRFLLPSLLYSNRVHNNKEVIFFKKKNYNISFKTLETKKLVLNLFSYLNSIHLNKKTMVSYFFNIMSYNLKDNINKHVVLSKLYNTNLFSTNYLSELNKNSKVYTILSTFFLNEGIQSLIDIKLYSFITSRMDLFDLDLEQWKYFCSYFYSKIVHLQMFLKVYSQSIKCASNIYSYSKYFLLNNEIDYTNVMNSKISNARASINDNISNYIESNQNTEFKKIFRTQKRNNNNNNISKLKKKHRYI